MIVLKKCFIRRKLSWISRFEIERLKEIFRESREKVKSIRTLSDENRSPADV